MADVRGAVDALKKMDDRELATYLASTRIGLGAAMVLFPGLMHRLWVGTSDPPGKAIMRSLGARDAVLGFGTLTAIKRGRPTRGWLEASAAADAADALGTILSWGKLPFLSRWMVLLSAGSSAAVHASLARNELTLVDELTP